MSDQNQITKVTGSVQSVVVTAQMMLVGVVFILLVFIPIFIVYLRWKGYSRTLGSSHSRRRHLVKFALGKPSSHRHAIDRAILNSLPITVYQSEDDGEGSECSVCLCKLTNGEEARFLPKCAHVFHVECIDMWFHSNSTCPLCRSPVTFCSTTKDEMALETQIKSSQEQGSSASSSSSSSGRREERVLVIEIPTRGLEGVSSSASPVSLGGLYSESVKLPALEKLRSLRRMMSRGKGEGVASSSSPRPGCDIEQGGIEVFKKQ